MKQLYIFFFLAMTTFISQAQCSVTATVSTLDCSGTKGKIVIHATGGVAPYQYSIDNATNNSTDSVFTNLMGGSYPILISDASGCIAQLTVLVPEKLSLYVVNMVENCTSTPGKFDLLASFGTGPYQYSINNGTTFTSNTSYSNLPSGPYTIILKDANGCLATSKDTVPLALEITAVTATKSCAGGNTGTISINGAEGAGNYTYSFDGGSNYGPMNSIANVAAGTFTVKIRDVVGCTVDTVVEIENHPEITPAITTVDVPCNGGGGEVDIVFSGTDTYAFSIDGGTTVQTGQTYSNNALTEGNYILNVVNAFGCGANFNFTIGIERIEDSIAKKNEFCAKANGEINAVGYIGVAPFEYSIDDGASFVGTGLFNNLSQNTYILHVKDAIGCVKIDTVTITNFGGIEATTIEEDTICLGSSTLLSVHHNGGSGVGYQWDNSLPNNQTNSVSPLVTTDYTVIITDVYGCKDTTSTRIVVNNVPSLTVNQNQFLACIGDTIKIIASGANQYSWSTGDTTSTVQIEVTGVTTYSVVGNIEKCLDQETIEVIIKPMPTLVMSANKTSIDTHDSIFFYSTGSVASSYVWDFKDGSTSIMSNPYHKFDFAGAYQVKLTVKMGGCKATDSLLVYVGHVAISELEKMTILVYPNPTTGLFTLSSDEDALLSMYTINGQLATTKEIMVGENIMSLESYPKGIYIGVVQSKGKTYQFKLIVE